MLFFCAWSVSRFFRFIEFHRIYLLIQNYLFNIIGLSFPFLCACKRSGKCGLAIYFAFLCSHFWHHIFAGSRKEKRRQNLFSLLCFKFYFKLIVDTLLKNCASGENWMFAALNSFHAFRAYWTDQAKFIKYDIYDQNSTFEFHDLWTISRSWSRSHSCESVSLKSLPIMNELEKIITEKLVEKLIEKVLDNITFTPATIGFVIIFLLLALF